MTSVHKISIIPRGISALGYTIQRPTEDRFLMTKMELENKMAVLLGGRAAENIVFNNFSTGAADDLDKVTDIAWNAVTKYGMHDKLGNVVYDKSQQTLLRDVGQAFKSRIYSDETAREIDCAVRELVHDALEKATDVLIKNKKTLLHAAAVL